jgi:serine/threonine protein kinase
MGDFGLATTHQAKASDEGDGDEKAEAEKVYDAIENISGLLGGALLPVSNTAMQSSAGGSRSSDESMTCGVGTTYYRAPEQESNTSFYTFHADMFSFGIILFEIFHEPFSTGMERAETLLTLRGDLETGEKKLGTDSHDLKARAEARFPASFVTSVPKNAQR